MKAVPDASALPTWRKSSYSENSAGGSIEVSDDHPGGIPVRDSKNPHGPAVTFDTTAWTTFITATKRGAFTAS
ncbi:DUF397 domain-containing protein [Streptomyces spirodelae]|uniref:DUF397 domain-containing protein n=1 Tax=Streptomyces spirodelae TaxID=2812904 RepID=A0ABS3WU09_9ACTN|nr:DUF397 domain-containing protein [Streptomyces spirodelae]MBO8186620.1 DUF397 domain-containing protein [Streptomyces spirodelae]